jgi:hypothetical protein
MPQLGQAQVGTLKSTPKLTKINGDDNVKVIYRNLGNNHAYPFVWATEATISGTDDTVLASGIKWHGYDLASYATVVFTPDGGPVGKLYIDKDITNNIVTLKSTGNEAVGINVDIMWMLGGDFTAEGLQCRGNTGAAQSLP